jgi:aspartate-semialdehyde dehydrogenase
MVIPSVFPLPPLTPHPTPHTPGSPPSIPDVSFLLRTPVLPGIQAWPPARRVFRRIRSLPCQHFLRLSHTAPLTASAPLSSDAPATAPVSAATVRLPDRPLRVAILGATGAVGQELLELLAERNFPVAELIPLASPRSAGRPLAWRGEELTIREVAAEAFAGVDVVLASAGGSISRAWAPVAAAAGAVVIDNSSAFRLDPEVPLVVPEVNPQAAFSHRGIIANPNCTTILLTLALAPLAARRPMRRVVVSTYQSASGAGARAMEELRELSRTVLEGGEPVSTVLPHSLAFNLFLHNSPLQPNGYCEEELKMLNETRKIMGLPDLRLTATCVRVPVLRAHSEAVNIEFAEPFPVEEARALLAAAPGVELIEDHGANRFPMPTDVTGRDPVAVGRIRQDLSDPNALELWLCGDQIRKGAALNAIQIAELLLEGPEGAVA